MPINRTGMGLLARHEAGSATHPFVAANWVKPTLDAVSVDAQGRLVYTTAGDGLNRAIYYSPLAARSKAFVHVEHLLDAKGGFSYMGVAALVDPADVSDAVVYQFSVNRTPELDILAENLNGANAVVASGLPPARTYATLYRQSLFVDAGVAAGRNHTAGTTLQIAPATLGAGRLGFLSTDSCTARVARWYAMADRYVAVAGVPTGGSAQVRTAADVVLASAVEAGGTATVDLFVVSVETAAKVVVLDSGGVVVDTLSPVEGVWGGDQYLYTPPVNMAPGMPSITVPSGEEYDESVSVAWGAAVDPDGDPLQYEGDYWDGAAWQPLFPLQAGLTYDWDTTALSNGDYLVRVRAFDGEDYGEYDEAALTIAHFPWIACPAPPVTAWSKCGVGGGGQVDTFEEAVLADQPWAYYRLAEATETIPQDVSGNERHGRVALDTTYMVLGEESPLAAGDPDDRGVLLTGSGLNRNPLPIELTGDLSVGVGGLADTPPAIYASSATRAALAGLPPRSFSIEFWFKPVEPTTMPPPEVLHDTTARVLWMAWHGGDDVSSSRDNFAGIGVNAGTNGIAIWGWATNFTQAFNHWECVPGLDWRHCVIVFTQTHHDGSGTAADLFSRIYVDGVYAGDHPDTVALRDESWAGSFGGEGIKDVLFLTRIMGINSAAGLGSGQIAASGFQGGLDEVAIYDYALSPEQIAAHYAARAGVVDEARWESVPEPGPTVWSQC